MGPKDKTTDDDTMDSDDSSGSSGSESDSEENSLAPPKLAPSNQDNPIFNDLLKNLNNVKSSGKNEILTPAEITLKEEASIEYSSGNNTDEDSEDSEDEDESSQQEEEPQKKPKTEIPSIVVSPAAAAAASIFASKKAKIPEISVPNITKKAEIISITKKKTPTVTVESTTSNATTEDEEVQGAGSSPVKVEISEKHVIPEAIRFDPAKSLENKPKGLVDSLTKYFTPGAKRTSRTALNSLIKPARELQDSSPQGSSSNPVGGSGGLKKRKKSSETAKLFSSGSERDETENISLSQMKKKNRRIKSLDQQNTPTGQQQTGGAPGNPSDSEGAGSNPASVGRRRHTSSGQSQVRSLYDGLSHLYTDCDSRLRHIPSTNYAEKLAGKSSEPMGVDGGQTSLDPKSPGKLSDPNSAQQLGGSQKSPGSNPVPRISSPHRMSDSELAAQKQRLALAALPTTELGLMPSSLNLGNNFSYFCLKECFGLLLRYNT